MAQGGYEPEVCLAVRIPKPTAPAAVLSGNQPNVDETTVVDDGNTDIDSTLMSFGFEYVDATRELISPKDRDPDTADDGELFLTVCTSYILLIFMFVEYSIFLY
jgi:hypothetical protein